MPVHLRMRTPRSSRARAPTPYARRRPADAGASRTGRLKFDQAAELAPQAPAEQRLELGSATACRPPESGRAPRAADCRAVGPGYIGGDVLPVVTSAGPGCPPGVRHFHGIPRLRCASAHASSSERR